MKKKIFLKETLNISKNIDIDFVKKIIVFDEIPSTNLEAKELARNGAEEGTIVIAQKQKKGRGRFNRTWESPLGGLYLSVILRPDISPDKTTLLPLIASLAVSKTINTYDLSATIKWPNDIRIRGKKVAGILLESEIARKQVQYIILGLGVNLNIDINQFSRDLVNRTTSLSHELKSYIDYQKFLERLLSMFDVYYSMFLNNEFNTILKEWKKQSDTLDRKVKIMNSSLQITGHALDVDQSGFLIVVTDSGEYKKISSGDCIYLR